MDAREAGKLGYLKAASKIQENNRASSLAARERYAVRPKICLTCGKQLPYEKRRSTFCDQSCAAKRTHLGRVRRKTPLLPCPRCGNEPKRYTDGRRARYCQACIDSGAYHARIQRSTDAKTGVGLRAYLLRTRKHVCNCCGLREWLGELIPLQVDHVDGNFDNNDEENLRLLCANCHALTPTYGALNKANKESLRNIKRRERYAKENRKKVTVA